MSEFDLETTIRELRATIDGEVLSRSRVIDALLDLRLDASGNPDVVGLVDQALAGVPGKNLVQTDWWREQLDLLELVAMNPAEPVA